MPLGLSEREKGFEIYQGEIRPKQHARLPIIALIFFKLSPAPFRLDYHGSGRNCAHTSIRRQSGLSLPKSPSAPHGAKARMRVVPQVARNSSAMMRNVLLQGDAFLVPGFTRIGSSHV